MMTRVRTFPLRIITIYFYWKGTFEDQVILEKKTYFKTNESNSLCHGIRKEMVVKDTKLFS